MMQGHSLVRPGEDHSQEEREILPIDLNVAESF